MPSDPSSVRPAARPKVLGTVVRGTQSIDRAVAVLRQVAQQHAQGVALSELVRESRLDRTTVYRTISALERAGLVTRDAQAPVYRLGVEVMALGAAAMQRAPLVAQCRPAMIALARRAEEPVFLVLRSGDHSHCLHLEQGPRQIRNFADTVGSMRLLGLGIPSFALLACMLDAEIVQHHARHAVEYQAQRMTLDKLQRWIGQTRALGHAQISAQGLGGVGVRFALGSCGDAALGVVSAASRIPRARGPALAELAREELARVGLV